MSNPMAYILKKLAIFCRRLVSGWHPTVKAAKGNNIHRARINRLGYNPYLKRLNQKLALKNWFFKLEKPPPFDMYSPLN